MTTSRLQRTFGSIRFLLIAMIAVFVFGRNVRAQIGNDNPTGTSGAFNGNVHTGCSYDPYTGNATRSVTDLAVAGSVGAYPLAFTRTMNTRYTPGAGTLEFGQAGTWRHNYQWSIDTITMASYTANRWTLMPGSYTVNYPDGRRIVFGPNSPYFRAFGISDRFQQPSNPSVSTDNCYLLLSDGGKVWFQVQIERQEDEDPVTGRLTVTSTFTFHFMGLIDPHNQITTISYPSDGSMTITEPAGRWLKLFYISTPWSGDIVIDRVVASDGRSVKYNYGGYTTPNGTLYTFLGNVVYFGDSTIVAIYAYQDGNVDPNGRPLIHWAIDCMYGGPMWAIGYTFVPGAAGGVYGQLRSENYLDPRTGTVGAAISTLNASGSSRTETRGDGPSRTFNYNGAWLVNHTDFKGVIASIGYDANGYMNAAIDRRQNRTDVAREPATGKPTQITHPLTPPDTVRANVQYEYGSPSCPDPNNRDANHPYYLYRITNERGRSTIFWRDENKRVIRVDYPNGAYETFSYNGFGQVLTHRMTSGGTETFRYDEGISPPRGLRTRSIPPATPSDPNPENHPTIYHYDGLDRVDSITDPRGNSTSFQYNARGQITRVTHPGGSFVQFGYDNHGDRISVTDELNHTTRWNYDDYKRVVNIINPLDQTTTINYALDWANSYLHTTANPKYVLSPTNKNVIFGYDENLRKQYEVAANTTADEAWTWFGYDPAGNLTSVQDPRNNVTAFGYDQRNRRINATNPAPFNNEVTRWEYDPTSNLTKEIRADQSFRRSEYDSMNQVIDTYGFANEHTQYRRDLAGNVIEMIDSKHTVYGFGYDALNRKIRATYPTDATGATRSETWLYDWAGNLYQYTNPAGQVRTHNYDARNRPWDSWWSASAGPFVSTRFDAAGRLMSVTTNGGETVVAFGYDDANRQIWEDQTVAGSPTRRIEHGRDADGNTINTHIPGWYLTWQTYTQRNQLAQIQDGNGNPWFNYSYDPAGNLKKRQAVYWGVNDSTNVMDGNGASMYDALNRPVKWENTGSGDNAFARSWQQYDSLGRMTATWRDEQATKGDRFGYDAMGQLTSVAYNADQVWTGNPQNPQRTVEYDVDALNRWSVSDSESPRANGLSVTYYSNVDFTGLAVLQNDATVNFNWNGAPPAPGMPSEWFSARWEGQVIPRYSETYTFYTQSDDGVRLWIDGQLIVDNWTYHAWTENSGTFTLAAGRKYSIRMEYFQGAGGAIASLLWSSPSQGKEVIPSSQLVAARPPNGLSATYYDNIDFTGTRVLRTDPAINFNWGVGSPEAAIDPETFSARWEGQIVPRYSETYTFYAGSDDGMRLWINGQLIVDAWYDRAYTESTGTIALVAGQTYDIRMDYYEKYSGALATLSWSSGRQPKEIVPQSQLFLPSGGGNYRSNALNQYTSVGGQALGYDAHFNLTSYDGATFSFNAENQLVSARRGTNTVQFVYDGVGRCLKRTTNGAAIIFAYDGWKPIAEWAGDGSWWAHRVYGAGPDEVLWLYDSRVGNMRAHSDMHGNVIALLDASGNGIEKYTYDAFGRPTITDWNGTLRAESAYRNRFLFQGREWIPELGIYDFRFRHYDPKLGRFLQSDPIGFTAGDANLFRYCGGDPVNRTDPLGLAGKDNPPKKQKQGPEGYTDPVVVDVPPAPYKWGGDAWIDANSPRGMLGFPNLGNPTIGDGIGSRSVNATFTRDSNQLGTSPAHPFSSSTQGWWTKPDGTPTGSSWVMNLRVQTAIEKGGQAGVKTLQSLTFNAWGQIVSHWGFVGTTGLFIANVHGWASFSAIVSTAGSQYRVNMAASSVTAVSPLIPGFAPIDYSFFFTGTFGAGQPTLSGAHDGYPSYTVWANGQSLYYHHETSLGDLRSPMEIAVGR